MKKVHKVKTSSDSDSIDSDKFKVRSRQLTRHKPITKESLRLKALERKQRSMESKVEEQEKKLADFAAKLSARKTKVSFYTQLQLYGLIRTSAHSKSVRALKLVQTKNDCKRV